MTREGRLHELELVPISKIRKSPENDELYKPVSRRDPEVRKLAKSIKQVGLLEPLRISRDNFIISGHRRFVACRLAGLREIPCIRDTRPHDHPALMKLLRECNRQRVKSFDEKVRESVIDVSQEDAYDWLLTHRRLSAKTPLDGIEIGSKRKRSKISSAKQPFLDAVKAVLNERKAYLPVSDRQIHYALLNNPPLKHASKADSTYMNDEASYKALTDLVSRARIQGLIPFEFISDETRPVGVWRVHDDVGPFISSELDGLFKSYSRNYMQSQPCHIEIIGEKNTIQGTVRRVASKFCIPYTIGRGYCSLPPRYELVRRFKASGKERLILLVLSDFDPDGEEIARSFARSIRDDFGIEPKTIKVALTREQVLRLKLPGEMRAKASSANYRKFIKRYGAAGTAHELESLTPQKLEEILTEAIESVINVKRFNMELKNEQRESKKLFGYRKSILSFIEAKER